MLNGTADATKPNVGPISLLRGTALTARDNTISDTNKSAVTLSHVTIEQQRASFGIGVDRPRLSWRVATNIPGWHQVAYQIASFGADGLPSRQTSRVESD